MQKRGHSTTKPFSPRSRRRSAEATGHRDHSVWRRSTRYVCGDTFCFSVCVCVLSLMVNCFHLLVNWKYYIHLPPRPVSRTSSVNCCSHSHPFPSLSLMGKVSLPRSPSLPPLSLAPSLLLCACRIEYLTLTLTLNLKVHHFHSVESVVVYHNVESNITNILPVLAAPRFAVAWPSTAPPAAVLC